MKYGGNKTAEHRHEIAEHLAVRDGPMDAAARDHLLRRLDDGRTGRPTRPGRSALPGQPELPGRRGAANQNCPVGVVPATESARSAT